MKPKKKQIYVVSMQWCLDGDLYYKVEKVYQDILGLDYAEKAAQLYAKMRMYEEMSQGPYEDYGIDELIVRESEYFVQLPRDNYWYQFRITTIND